MQPPSNTEVAPGKIETQSMKIENETRQPIRLRLKISFETQSGTFEEILEFSNFDSNLWS